ncbi:MAG TPA: acyltransferase [Terriglobales bacterium]|nr:acyltransferase [Terriglobales bacterium]
MSAIAVLPERDTSVRFYRPELDALRFFAFLGVYASHALVFPPEVWHELHLPETFSAIPRAGAYGVDLFFLLSAYLITELLLREKEAAGSLNVRKFYIRRILRIWPLYFVFLFVCMIPVLNPGREFTWKYLAAFLLLCGNWAVAIWGWGGRVVNSLWSVSVEEQFYLLWAPVVARLSRRNIILAAIAMLEVANLARIGIPYLFPQVKAMFFWTSTITRLDPIAIGILIAVLLKGRIPTFAGWQRALMSLAGIGLIVTVEILSRRPGHSILLQNELYTITAFACALIFCSTLGIRTTLPGWLIYLGKISYGLYVFHLLGVFLTDRLLLIPNGLERGALRALISMAFIIGMASLSYRYLEMPFLRLKDKFTRVPSRPV